MIFRSVRLALIALKISFQKKGGKAGAKNAGGKANLPWCVHNNAIRVHFIESIIYFWHSTAACQAHSSFITVITL